MYEAVRARPAGPSTVTRLAATAADLGYEGVVVVNPPDMTPVMDRDAVEATFGIDVVDGVTLAPGSRDAVGGTVGRHRSESTVLVLEGGAPSLDAVAVRDAKVDVLARTPTGDGDLDHVLVRTAAEHGVRLAVDLGPVLRSSGRDRSRAIVELRQLRELIADADAPYVVTGSPGSHLELRAPRDLASAATTAGFDRAGVEAGLAEWGRLAAANRQRLSTEFVEPGVRRGPWEGEG